MEKGQQLTKEVIERQQASFKEVQTSVQVYLEKPQCENPTDAVNTYFKKMLDSDLESQEAIEKTAALLFDTRSRLLNRKNFDLYPQFGTLGTIAMELPYFYPLHTAIFNWYVEANMKAAQRYNSKEKKKLAKKLEEDIAIYGIFQDEATRVEKRLFSLRSPSGRRPSPWYKRFL